MNRGGGWLRLVFFSDGFKKEFLFFFKNGSWFHFYFFYLIRFIVFLTFVVF